MQHAISQPVNQQLYVRRLCEDLWPQNMSYKCENQGKKGENVSILLASGMLSEYYLCADPIYDGPQFTYSLLCLQINELEQERCNSIANALELHLFCTNPLTCPST